jgi:hypothetical protein
MATPTYATDLLDITTDSDAFTAVGAGGALTTAETDFYIQGNNCLSKATGATWDTNAYGGALHNDGADRTIPTNGAVFAWIYFWGSAALATEANGGYALAIGNLSTAYKTFEVRGSDNWEFGGWECTPVDPDTFWASPHRTVGAPTGTYSWFGAEARVAAAANIGKGNPFGLDAIRYGRGELRCTDGDVTNGYASFGGSSPDAGAAAYDNTAVRRWGLMTPRNGAFFQQGLFIMGLAGTAVDFRDSNRVIFIQNTKKVTSLFNGFEIRHALSRVDWTNISVQALGTVSPGYFTVVDNADVNLDSCTFTDMGAFTFQSATTAIDCTFRRCAGITSGGATFSGCTITRSTAAASVTASSPSDIEDFTGCTFVSDGTNHAIDLGTVSATASVSWANFLTGYAGTDGSTGNEALKVNVASGQTLTISVTSGYDTPYIYNTGSGTVTVVTGTRTVTVAVTSVDGPVSGANVYLAAAAGGPFPSGADPDDVVTITSSGTTATVSHTNHGMATGDQFNLTGITDKIADNGVHTITGYTTNSYTYSTTDTGSDTYTGTIKSTFVFLKGLATAGTDSNEISMTRSIPSAQPVTGWARKTSVAPDYDPPNYKQGAISGAVSSTGDTTFTPVLISDD